MAHIPNIASAARTPHSGGHHGTQSVHDQIVKHTQRVVSQAFFGTLLKQMHEGPFKSKMFDGGRGGEAFSSLLDQNLSDRMASGSGKKLVNAMVKHIERAKNINQHSAPRKKTVSQEMNERRGRPAPSAKDRRLYVPTDFRA